MSSRFTVDTNLLRIRDVTALNPTNNGYIEPFQIPQIYQEGKLKWYSSLEFLSTISIPAVSCTVLQILSSVQPGICTMSTINNSTTTSFIRSTVEGLGDSLYVSTSYLENKIVLLSQVYKYISATTLYDAFVHLADMRWIGDNNGPMRLINSNLSNGYVSTVNPGRYSVYRSSMGFEGSNIVNTSMDSTSNLPSIQINPRGFSTLLTNASKFQIDIDLNALYNFIGGLSGSATLQTFLVAADTNNQIGQAIVNILPAGLPVFSQGHLRFLIGCNQFTPWPTSLQLRHRFTTLAGGNTVTMYTNVPTSNGVFITLDNLD